MGRLKPRRAEDIYNKSSKVNEIQVELDPEKKVLVDVNSGIDSDSGNLTLVKYLHQKFFLLNSGVFKKYLFLAFE